MESAKRTINYVLPVLVVYLLVETASVLVRLWLSSGSFDPRVDGRTELLYNLAQLLATLGGLYLCRASLGRLWALDRWTGRHTAAVLGILGLFLLNNYAFVQYGDNSLAPEQTPLVFALLGITISSVTQELMYRGIVQSYIDEQRRRDGLEARLPITMGNAVATAVFVVRHLGFYAVFDPLFATTGLLLVLVFSLVAGWLRSTVGALWICALLHVACNWIYLIAHHSAY